MLPQLKEYEEAVTVLQEIQRTSLAAAARAARALGAMAPDEVATSGLAATLVDMVDKFKPVKAGIENAKLMGETIGVVGDQIRALREQAGLPFAAPDSEIAGEPVGSFVNAPGTPATDPDAPPPPDAVEEPEDAQPPRNAVGQRVVRIVPAAQAARPPAATMLEPSRPPELVDVDLDARPEVQDPPAPATAGENAGGYVDVD